MSFRTIVIWIAGVIFLAAVWFYWWCQPERQVRYAQGRLVSAVENRDFDAMAALLAEDYSDRWHHNKAVVVNQSREVFSYFPTLSIERDDRGLESKDKGWVLLEKLTIKSLGGPVFVRDEVNSLSHPFRMTWRRRSWKPWDWELTSVDNPGLELSR